MTQFIALGHKIQVGDILWVKGCEGFYPLLFHQPYYAYLIKHMTLVKTQTSIFVWVRWNKVFLKASLIMKIRFCIWNLLYVSNPKLHEPWKIVRTAFFTNIQTGFELQYFKNLYRLQHQYNQDQDKIYLEIIFLSLVLSFSKIWKHF